MALINSKQALALVRGIATAGARTMILRAHGMDVRDGSQAAAAASFARVAGVTVAGVYAGAAAALAAESAPAAPAPAPVAPDPLPAAFLDSDSAESASA